VRLIEKTNVRTNKMSKYNPPSKKNAIPTPWEEVFFSSKRSLHECCDLKEISNVFCG
jgi:hypothetical protein